MNRPLLSLLLLIIPVSLFAQFTPKPDWRFENFNSQNHFTNRGISNVCMDKYGYIWTSNDGIQRFDGYKMVEYNSFTQLPGSLRSNYTDVTTDRSGQLWVYSQGVCYYDYASGKFVYLKQDAAHIITDVNAWLQQNDYLWFVCDFGLARLDTRTHKIIFTSLSKITDPLFSFLVDDNTLLISSREKIYIYHIKENTFTTHVLISDNALLKVFGISKNGSGIFLATNNGLFEIKDLNSLALPVRKSESITINDLVFLPQDKERKYLFMATEGKGLLVYNTISGKIEYTYVHDDNNPYSLPSSIISRFFVDQKERLWMATDRGVSMLDVSNPQMKMRFLSKKNSEELGINKVARDKYDSTRVWMSSYNEGMKCVNWETKQIEKSYDSNADMQTLYDFIQLSENKWLLATQKKILEWNPKQGITASHTLPLADSMLLVCNIRRLIPVNDKLCFITSNKGLFRYDIPERKITLVSENKTSDRSEDAFKYILLDGFYDNGALWITSRNGLFNYNIATNKTVIYRGEGNKSNYYLFDIAPAGIDKIVCVTSSGINIFDKRTHSFKVINTIAGLYKPACETAITIDNKIWIGSEVGIINYDLVTQQSWRAGHENTMMQVYPSSRFIRIGNDIVFGFRSGYAYFTTGLQNDQAPSNPIIEKIYVNNRPVILSKDHSAPKLTFRHYDNSINVAFTSFLYSDPDHIRFRYKLKGADSRWQYAEDQRSANFAQLPPGDYTFYVQCGNKNGVWNRNIAFFNFIITPPYWATWWFRTLVILAIAFGLYRLYRYRIKNLLAIEKIRERIASDFHDDIGSALSSISIFSEVADNQLQQNMPREHTREIIGRISYYSRAMLDAMDDIIWAVNPQNDHFNDLAVRMREFAIPLLEAKNIQFDINIREDILNTRVKMETRKNIFMIFKECINNILKHSNCTEMKVSVNKLNNQLELTISDNGKGFDLNTPHTRNGLKNMQKRATEIGGKIQVTSSPGNGTVTKLQINII